MYFVKSTELNIDPTKLLQNLVKLYLEHNYEEIQKIFMIEHDPNYNKDEIPVYKYQKNSGMIFCDDDNPSIPIRIHVDEETRHILNILLIVSSNLIDEKKFIDSIIEQWIKDIQLNGLSNNNKTPKNKDNESYIQLKVGKSSWDNLSIICKTNYISMRNGFKMSILSYLNELCQRYNETM